MTDFPYEVTISENPNWPKIHAAVAWIYLHVGNKGDAWEWRSVRRFAFKLEDDAITFSVIWSGS